MSEQITITTSPSLLQDAEDIRAAIQQAKRELLQNAALQAYRAERPIPIPHFSLPYRLYRRVLANFPRERRKHERPIAPAMPGDDGTLAYLVELGLIAHEQQRKQGER